MNLNEKIQLPYPKKKVQVEEEYDFLLENKPNIELHCYYLLYIIIFIYFVILIIIFFYYIYYYFISEESK